MGVEVHLSHVMLLRGGWELAGSVRLYEEAYGSLSLNNIPARVGRQKQLLCFSLEASRDRSMKRTVSLQRAGKWSLPHSKR